MDVIGASSSYHSPRSKNTKVFPCVIYLADKTVVRHKECRDLLKYSESRQHLENKHGKIFCLWCFEEFKSKKKRREHTDNRSHCVQHAKCFTGADHKRQKEIHMLEEKCGSKAMDIPNEVKLQRLAKASNVVLPKGTTFEV